MPLNSQQREEMAYDLAVLFQDKGFNVVQRNAWLKTRFGRTFSFVDELKMSEIERATKELREMEKKHA